MYKKYGSLGLFLLLAIILMIKPRVFFNLYNNILGRVVLIGVIIFFTVCNVTLGLLMVLCLIIVSNMFFMEGMDSMIQPGLTIGDDTITDDSKITITTGVKKRGISGDGTKISEIQEKAKEAKEYGIDLQSVQESIQSKSSKSLPVDKTTFRSDHVNPSETTSTTTGTEGFSGSRFSSY
jgi:hypothetical protein